MHRRFFLKLIGLLPGLASAKGEVIQSVEKRVDLSLFNCANVADLAELDYLDYTVHSEHAFKTYLPGLRKLA